MCGLQALPFELSEILLFVSAIPANILITISNLILGEKPKTVANLNIIGLKFLLLNFFNFFSISTLFFE